MGKYFVLGILLMGALLVVPPMITLLQRLP
jgi:ABC-type Mn2+/Zn2+ transport system permease subunit